MKKNYSTHSSSDDGNDTDISMSNKQEQTAATWKDVIVFFYFLPYMVAFFIIWYYLNHNMLIFLWLFYVVAPVLDIVSPVDNENLSKNLSKAYEKDKRFLIPLYTMYFIDFFIYFWSIYQVSNNNFYGLVDQITLLLAIVHSANINMVVGHELMHRRQLVHKVFGTLAYSKVLYSHFFIEHVKGHHKNIATPLDPASSKIGENLYSFVFKSFFGSYKSVWKYETKRLEKKQVSGLAGLLRNRLVIFNIAHF